MLTFLRPLLIALPLPLLFACVSHQESQSPETQLGTTLEVAPTIQAGSQVPIKFTFENQSSQNLQLLMWNTPLEGLYNKFFRVTRDGVELPYQGIMAKRAEPTAESYTQIPAHGEKSAVVDLAKAYDLSAPGTYTVEFLGTFHDYSFEAGAIPRSGGRQMTKVPSAPVEFKVVVR